MARGEAKIFECILCCKGYSKQDAQKGRYFPTTRVCRRCYKKMAKSSPKIWCFGKPQQGKLPGYSSTNDICNKVCPDRDICVRFVNKQQNKENKRGT